MPSITASAPRGAGNLRNAVSPDMRDDFVVPVKCRLTMDEARRFLECMAANEQVTFQTFDDNGSRKDQSLARILHGDLDECGSRLEDLNARGAGIFWMVNYGNGRKSEDVTDIRALFLDLDGAPIEPVLAAGVKPHAVVESSPGKWHVYWLVFGCALPQFKPAQQALAAKFGGDPSVCDLPRVLRVPGFQHRKGEPFATRIESLVQMRPYAFGDLLLRLGLDLTASARPQKRELHTDPVTSANGGKVTHPGRHEHLRRKLADLNWRGIPEAGIRVAIHDINTRECSPPKTPEEVDSLVDDWLRRYNGEHGRDLTRRSPRRQLIESEADFLPGAIPEPVPGEQATKTDGVVLGDFFAHMPSHQYLFVPTRELWPASSVNGRVPWPEVAGKRMAPAAWLDSHRAVEQMAWHPSEPSVIRDRVLQISGWARHDGAAVFNLYRPPEPPQGEADGAGPWIEHLRRVYPDDHEHIIKWLAHRVQRPGEKCNHALVLGGSQGIGKDTLLEPLKAAVGPWNWSDISPAQMIGRFNGWAKAVVVRVSEARDLGDVDRFAFYDHSKVIIAAPPDVLRVDEKHLRETYVINCCGVIITTNHLTDGLYLPADDRRHYLAWSPRSRDDFDADCWTRLYAWFAQGGIGHVCAYLAQFDLSGFDPKAPPPKTVAFWSAVAAGEAPESGELRDVLDAAGNPAVLTLQQLIDGAGRSPLAVELQDRRNRRSIPHRLDRVGYVPVRNPNSEDGLFKIQGRRQVVYGQRGLTLAAQVQAARALG